MMQKSSTFTTIFRVKKCYFHYDFACKKSDTFITICKKDLFLIQVILYSCSNITSLGNVYNLCLKCIQVICQIINVKRHLFSEQTVI
jgi:hypothetical protein